MAKLLSTKEMSDTLTLTQCADGWWLWDSTRKMNLAMCAVSRESALLECIAYYQNRLSTVETDHRELAAKVDAFVSQFITDDEE